MPREYRYFSFCVNPKHNIGPDDGLIKPKHVAYASETDYTLCFDWWLTLFSSSGLQHKASVQLQRLV